jgi:LysR family glycine cleavage system transcriptional activator
MQIDAESEWGYDLVYRTGNGDHPRARAFRNWIVDEIEATP